MSRTYHYHGFDIEVAVETDFSWKAGPSAKTSVGFVAVVRISKAGASVAVFSPLRFGESPGKPFLRDGIKKTPLGAVMGWSPPPLSG